MIKNLGIMVLATLIALLVAEVALRKLGWNPGQFQYNKWIEQVDELVAIEGFIAGENGIFRVDTSVAHQVLDYAKNPESDGNIGSYCSENDFMQEVGAVVTDHLITAEKEVENEFIEAVGKIQEQGQMSLLDSLILNYQTEPINRSGFYSIPFKPYCKGKGRVLLLGDSFTWGHSTSNKTLSFANRLLARGYAVLNTGISGADFPQYEQILKVYADSLQPDVVVLSLFMGNDITPFERTVEPNMPYHFNTNAGNILSFQADEQMSSMQEAYDNVMSNMFIPETDWINRLAAKTVVTTIIWTGLARLYLVDCSFKPYPEEPEIPETREVMLRVIEFCQSRKLPLKICIIPRIEIGQLTGAEAESEVFENVEFHQPEMTIEHYRVLDGHFNDTGHKIYADFLQNLIEEELSGTTQSE